jgi:hypothetical protein
MSNRLGIPLLSTLVTPSGILILFGSHEKAHELLLVQKRNPLVKYVVMNSELPGSNAMRNKYYLKLMENNVVFNMDSLPGYSPIFFEFPYTPSSQVRDIDVLFLGVYSPKRERILNDLKQKYPEKNIVFNFDGRYPDPTTILQRTKLVLNIPFFENKVLETHRINKALACGCQVISLGEENALYKEYVTFTQDDIDLEVPQENKKGYVELLQVADRYGKHNRFILEQILMLV